MATPKGEMPPGSPSATPTYNLEQPEEKGLQETQPATSIEQPATEDKLETPTSSKRPSKEKKRKTGASTSTPTKG